MIRPCYENIPAEMRAARRWACHRNKVPVNPSTGRGISCADAGQWVSFDEAAQYVGAHDGLSFALGGGFVGIDGDGVTIDEAASVIRMIGSYAEVSTSGNGIHIILKGRKPGARCRKGKWECYDSGRFFTMTGVPATSQFFSVVEAQEGLEQFYRAYIDNGQQVSNDFPHTGAAEGLGSAEDIIQRIRDSKQGAMFSDLFDGGCAGLNASVADMRLMNILPFWCGGDPSMMEQVFSRSALAQRGKWQERKDYRERTIKAALATWTGQRFIPKDEYIKSLRTREKEAIKERFRRMMKAWD